MRQRCAGWAATAGFLAAIGLGSSARAQETEIAIKDVPRAVMDSAKAKFPGAKMREASKETDYYEFHLTTVDKKSAGSRNE